MAELPGQVDRLHELLDRQDLSALRDLAHQIKGCAGLYQFDSISKVAASVEDAVRAEDELAGITQQVESLVDLIRGLDGYEGGKEQFAIPSGGAA